MCLSRPQTTNRIAPGLLENKLDPGKICHRFLVAVQETLTRLCRSGKFAYLQEIVHALTGKYTGYVYTPYTTGGYGKAWINLRHFPSNCTKGGPEQEFFGTKEQPKAKSCELQHEGVAEALLLGLLPLLDEPPIPLHGAFTPTENIPCVFESVKHTCRPKKGQDGKTKVCQYRHQRRVEPEEEEEQDQATAPPQRATAPHRGGRKAHQPNHRGNNNKGDRNMNHNHRHNHNHNHNYNHPYSHPVRMYSTNNFAKTTSLW